MAVVIRLSKTGANKKPLFRIVVMESSLPAKGKFIECIGTYNPIPIEEKIVINEERLKFWLARGAKPSGRVSHLISRSVPK